MIQLSFSKKEFKNTINKYNNLFSPRPNHVLQKYLKVIIENNKYLLNIINIANVCINIGYQLLYFKTFSLIIITKPNKMACISLKMFCPIILLNTLGKLIKKVIGERLQYQSITMNFVHLYQLDSLKQYLTTNTSVLTHLICSEQVKSF